DRDALLGAADRPRSARARLVAAVARALHAADLRRARGARARRRGPARVAHGTSLLGARRARRAARRDGLAHTGLSVPPRARAAVESAALSREALPRRARAARRGSRVRARGAARGRAAPWSRAARDAG